MRERKHRVGLLASGAPPSWRAIMHPSVSSDGEHLSTWLSLAESLWSLLIFWKVDQLCNFPTHREVNPGPPFCSRLILSSFIFSVHLLRESFPRAGVCTHFFCPHFQSLQLCRPFHFPFSFKYPTAPFAGVVLFPIYSGNEATINRLTVCIHDPFPPLSWKKDSTFTCISIT